MQRVRDDDFDERGILKDGHRMRVPMMMMDARRGSGAPPLVTDGSGDSGLGLHRPGFRLSAASARDARQQAYDAYERDLINAYQRDAPDQGTKPAKDALPTMDTRTDAYAQYDREISEQWKGPGR